MKDLIKATVLFAAGAAVGAAAALLLTNKTGEEMRKEIKDLASEAKHRAQDYCAQVKEQVKEGKNERVKE